MLSHELFLEQITDKVTVTGVIVIPLPDVVAYLRAVVDKCLATEIA